MRLLLRMDLLKENHFDLGSQDMFILKGNIYELAKLCRRQVFNQ